MIETTTDALHPRKGAQGNGHGKGIYTLHQGKVAAVRCLGENAQDQGHTRLRQAPPNERRTQAYATLLQHQGRRLTIGFRGTQIASPGIRGRLRRAHILQNHPQIPIVNAVSKEKQPPIEQETHM